MGAFYSCEPLKAMTVNRLVGHAERGEFTNEHYFETQNNTGCPTGCAIGCAIRSDLREEVVQDMFAQAFNMPACVGHFLDGLFLKMDEKRKTTLFVADYMANIPVGFKGWDRFWVLAVGHMLEPICKNPELLENLVTHDDTTLGLHDLFMKIKGNLDPDPHLMARRILTDLKAGDSRHYIDLSLANMIDIYDLVSIEIEDESFPKALSGLFMNMNRVMQTHLVHDKSDVEANVPPAPAVVGAI